jgi:hypothetical protein
VSSIISVEGAVWGTRMNRHQRSCCGHQASRGRMGIRMSCSHRTSICGWGGLVDFHEEWIDDDPFGTHGIGVGYGVYVVLISRSA